MPQSATAFETIEVLSNDGRLAYAIDNSGNTDIAGALQSIFDDIAKIEQASATITFAYVSKCLDIGKMGYSSITGNTLLNWELSTGSATHGAFCYIGGPSQNITITGNSLQHQVDSRAKTRTIDDKPNGRSFIHFEDCDRLNFANNVIDTVQTQTVVRLHNCRESVIVDNIIKHGNGGSAVAQTGTSKNNFYRPIKPDESAAFDAFID